jgi:predicted dehydrogenase
MNRGRTMQDRIRWGILGTGSIAKKFAVGLAAVGDAELVAVGSRRQETADAFGDEFHVPRRHPSYEALAGDAEVDVIYVATPHSLHKANTLLCLEAGKAVLCEKPFAINADEAGAMIGAARASGLFLMEAMWTRFSPVMGKVRELLAEGAVGEPRLLIADFGFRAGFDPERRLFNPELGGGALLDVGVYCVSLDFMVFRGSPERIAAMAHLGETGVDEQSAFLLGHDRGQIAVLSSAVRTQTAHEARVFGTEGSLHIPRFWHPQDATLSAGGEKTRIELPFEGNGYNYEAAEVNRCLRAGATESEVLPLDETLAVMQTLDEIRGQWGLRYPME